ncbi:MAG TPA: TerC family protein [Vicinamibacterales bacterium]
MLFPFADYWWFYAGFTIFVLIMLAIDLGVFHRKEHVVSMREAARWSVVWIALSLLFNFGLYQYAASKFSPEVANQVALEFLAGYVVEYTLSVDNMFVFVVIFSFFSVPSVLQHRVLFYGILGALVFRAIFIALGSVLLSYHAVVILFGAVLILTGVRLLFHDSADANPERNPLVRLTRRLMPVTPGFHGKHFFVTLDGRRHATPLLLALMAIEMSDIVFAIDSVPAIFALTKEPLIVFTSNIFAILGLRSLYFVLAAAVARFSLLRFGLAGVLIFIGLKMSWLNPFPITWSLAIIAGLVGSSIVASLIVDRRRPERDETAAPPRRVEG